jgi:hypothetical protein
MNSKYLLAVPILLVIGGFLTVSMFSNTVITGTTMGTEAIEHGGATCVKVIRADGTVEDLGCKHNTFMDEGKKFLADEIGTTASTNYVNQMLLGNTSSTADSTLGDHPGIITDCGLAPATITWADHSVGVGNISATYTWTSTCDGILVNTTGLNCSTCSATTNYFAGNDFTTAATLNINDQLNVTWYVWSQ